MRILMLYGVNGTNDIWRKLAPYLKEYEVDYVQYPHELTLQAEQVEELTKWVYEQYGKRAYQAVIGHSLGGLIALQLASRYQMKFGKIIYLDTNLKPAKEFYRSLMMPEHMNDFGQELLATMQEERKSYNPNLFKVLQEDFDYTRELDGIHQKVYALYGDRGQPDYAGKIEDLNLPKEVLEKLELRFISDACHMMMLENLKRLYETIEEILTEREPKLILLRGNSGSGKSTVAKALQKQLGQGTLLISQDVIRREMLWVKDGKDTKALPLLMELVAYGKKHCEYIILEGILNSKWYRPLFEFIEEEFLDSVYAFYYELPFEETLKRHETKPNCKEFGEQEMRRWWMEKDFIECIPESVITKDWSVEETTTFIVKKIRN